MGLFNLFGLTIGTWVVIVAVMLVVFSGILLMRIPRFTTIITSFLVGAFIDVWMIFIQILPTNNIIGNFVIFIFGEIFISLGIAIYLVSGLPPSPIDYFMLSIKERFNISIGLAKTISEAVGIAIGLLVRGPIGIGTIIIMLTMGPIIQFFLKYTTSLFNKLTSDRITRRDDIDIA